MLVIFTFVEKVDSWSSGCLQQHRRHSSLLSNGILKFHFWVVLWYFYSCWCKKKLGQCLKFNVKDFTAKMFLIACWNYGKVGEVCEACTIQRHQSVFKKLIYASDSIKNVKIHYLDCFLLMLMIAASSLMLNPRFSLWEKIKCRFLSQELMLFPLKSRVSHKRSFLKKLLLKVWWKERLRQRNQNKQQRKPQP